MRLPRRTAPSACKPGTREAPVRLRSRERWSPTSVTYLILPRKTESVSAVPGVNIAEGLGTRKWRGAVPCCGTMRRTPRHDPPEQFWFASCRPNEVAGYPRPPEPSFAGGLKKHRASRNVQRVRHGALENGRNSAHGRPTDIEGPQAVPLLGDVLYLAGSKEH